MTLFRLLFIQITVRDRTVCRQIVDKMFISSISSCRHFNLSSRRVGLSSRRLDLSFRRVDSSSRRVVLSSRRVNFSSPRLSFWSRRIVLSTRRLAALKNREYSETEKTNHAQAQVPTWRVLLQDRRAECSERPSQRPGFAYGSDPTAEYSQTQNPRIKNTNCSFYEQYKFYSSLLID